MTDRPENQPDTDGLFPALPLEEWEVSKGTVHKILRLLGKIRVTLAPPRNHWWNATMFLSPVGITTGPVPYRGSTFDVEADLLHHQLRIRTSGGVQARLSYDDLRATVEPASTLLDFFESAYRAGANCGGWDLEALSTAPR